MTLAQKAVDTQTNEIPISTEILSAFDVKGMIVTTDALLTQRFLQDSVCFGRRLCGAGGKSQAVTSRYSLSV